MPLADPDLAVVAGKNPSGNEAMLAVDDQGRLITTSIPVAGPGFNEVKRSLVGDLAGNTSEDDVYVIPSGKVLLLQSFSGGADAGASGSANTKIELYDDPNGDGTGMTLLRVGYLQGSNFVTPISLSFTGDGTAAIRMRRESTNAGTREAAAFWEGSVEA